MTDFLINKYSNWYFSIIENAKRENLIDGETEIHHIIPVSLGGGNEESNLVCLSIRKHFLCHWLLTKMVGGSGKYKMYKALHKMSQGRILSTKQYEVARLANIRAMRENNPTKDIKVRDKIREAHKGMSHSDETKQKMSRNSAKYWQNKPSPKRGFVFYNNGKTQGMFVEGTQPEGWVRGRVNKPWNFGKVK